MTPAGTSNELDVQNEWEENTHNTYFKEKSDALQQYIQYTILCSHVGPNSVLFAKSLVPLLLFTNKERSSSKRRTEGGIADETFMPTFKRECFGSATPSWVHTGLTASTMNVKCHPKHENRRSLYCSSSSHQKSVSADDNQNTTSPALPSPEPTS